MANPYSVTIKNIVDDGTNIFVDMSVSSGLTTSPVFTPVFPHGTTAATIRAYAQTIANNQPTLDSSVAALVSLIVAAV